MGISTKTHKMLWGKSGNRCAMPECGIELVMDITETDDETLIGEECHIIAKKSDGPRGNKFFDISKLNLYENLILMCRNHHKVIDDNPDLYTIEKLKLIKKEHEKWVQSQLTSDDKEKLKVDLIYTTYIDEWVKLCDLDNWHNWTSWLMSADGPSIYVETLNSLEKLKIYLFTRIWPNEYIELENAFTNFMKVLEDLLNQFSKHRIERNDMFYTEKFHKLQWHEQSIYDKLFNEYMFHFYLVQDLTVELTRSANYICSLIRKYIDYKFRLEEGYLYFESGPFMDMSFKKYRVSYSNDNIKQGLYNGLESFKEERINRDYTVAVGKNSKDIEFIKFLNAY